MRRLSVAAFALLSASACTDPIAQLGDLVEVDTDTGGDPIVPMLLATSPPRGVDILVVVDNTVDMATAQARLAAELGDRVAALAAVNDVRISFTTTDSGNPGCVGTVPEAGALAVTSCQARADNFVAGEPPLDDLQTACLDVCSLPTVPIVPTLAGVASDAKPRPWIESIAGVANVEVDLAQAVRCAAPQGTNGCEFEQPLESMRNAVNRTLQIGEPAEGFVRPDAAFAVIIVTNEVDCSHDPAWQEIFAASGSQTFWTNPGQAMPTSGVCWNAGVTCSGGSDDAWGQCDAAQLDVAGQPAAAGASVMYALSRYVALFEEIAADKAAYLAAPPLSLLVVAGVPAGYQAGVTAPSYPRDASAEDLVEYGIGSVCGGPWRATPAVRLRALAESEADVVAGRVSSICDLDFTTALEGLGDEGQPNLAPLCVPECAADLDGASGGLQPECTVTQEQGSDDGRISFTVPPCRGVPAAPQLIDGSDVCWYPRIDRVGSTPDPADDVDPACIEAGTNLQIQIVRAGGTLEPGGTSIFAACEPDAACP